MPLFVFRRLFVFLGLSAFLLAAGAPASAQDEEEPLTVAEGWRSKLTGQLAFNQAAYSNWQEGGLDALAFTVGTNGRFARLMGRFKQTHDARLAFGLVKQDTLQFRKAVDVIRYAFQLQYTGTGHFQPTFATDIRTQFAAGFDYDPDPEAYPTLADRIVPGERLKVADFFAPAIWTQTVGITYDPDRWYTARLGFATKETIVLIDRLRPVYGNALDETVRVQAGLEFLAEAQKELFENVLLQSRLSLFQAFNQLDSAAPDLVFENILQLKVNDWLNTNLELVSLYDKDTIDKIQLKEVLSIGVAIRLL
ncbi:MAG: DUF3078 domain-containing protein [Rhodothermales bacterium]